MTHEVTLPLWRRPEIKSSAVCAMRSVQMLAEGLVPHIARTRSPAEIVHEPLVTEHGEVFDPRYRDEPDQFFRPDAMLSVAYHNVRRATFVGVCKHCRGVVLFDRIGDDLHEILWREYMVG